LNGTYQDEVFSNDREDLDELLDARTILDATFGISTKDERHRLTFIIKNLTDENYATQVIDGQNVPTSLIASGRALRYQIPREADRYFGVNYRVQF
jgi:iron complex outermembrane receptor protein